MITPSSAVLLLGLLVSEAPEPPAKSPQESLTCIRTRPGFQVELVAAEPLVQSPIGFAWGPDGKLWVVEMGDYPLGVDGKGKPGGRIKILESTKGDGKYDKATVFLEGLGFPTSVLPWRKGALVTCAPDIFYAEDTDGDGKADRRATLYSGFVKGNPQHRVNSLVWGLDNWIYGANGDSGGVVLSPRTLAAVNIRGRDFRIRPDTGGIELQTGQSQYGRSRDDWGNWFGGNNSNPMWHFALDDHYLRRNPHLAAPDPRVPVSVQPGAAPVYPVSRTLPRFNDLQTANHFTSACSPIVYRDELFGPPFANNTFVCEPVHNLVHREIMTPEGTTFTSRRADDEQRSEFLASSDNWFRPVWIQTGPDGALWVADMYRHVIEHPEWIPKDWQKKLDLRAGHDKGRIYRVFPIGAKPREIPRLDKLDAAGLVAALDSPNGWQRDMAQQMLLWRNDKTAREPLQELFRTSARPLARLHALCTLDGLNVLDADLVVSGLADAHPGVRRQALRLLERFPSTTPKVQENVTRLLDDPDPQVRLQLAYSLGRWPVPWVGQTLGRLALKDAGDRFILAAAMSSVNRNNLEAVLLVILEAMKTESPPPMLVENLLRMAVAVDAKPAMERLLAVIARPAEGRYAPWQFRALAGLLDALDRPIDLKPLHGLFDAARATLAGKQATPADRILAIRILGREPDRLKEDLTVLAGLLTPHTSEELQAATVASLGNLRGPQVPAALLRGWKGYSPAVRTQVTEILLRREDWTRDLLEAIERKKILPAEIDAPHRQRVLGHKSNEVRGRAAKLFADAINPDRQKVVVAYQPALALTGDAARGGQLFVKHCANCHRFGNVGQQVGPDLASVGDKSAEGLLIAILDPNRAVEARYLNYVATTKNGLTFTGVLLSETGNSVTLVGTDGKPQTIARGDLEDLVVTDKSAMPEGLEKDLKPQEIADLLAHLRAGMPGPERRSFPGNKPEVVTAAADGALLLPATKAEIYGSNVILEEKYHNLGFWRSQDDHAVWWIDVPRAGKYDVELDYACDGAATGNRFLLQAGVNQLTGPVPSTGSWDTYKQARVGAIDLATGKQRVVFRSADRIHTYLIDLRSVRLVPATK
jgi:putative membrane-bound dehydrogenase-like protein